MGTASEPRRLLLPEGQFRDLTLEHRARFTWEIPSKISKDIPEALGERLDKPTSPESWVTLSCSRSSNILSQNTPNISKRCQNCLGVWVHPHCSSESLDHWQHTLADTRGRALGPGFNRAYTLNESRVDVTNAREVAFSEASESRPGCPQSMVFLLREE